ncbi:hypothetical protein ACFWPU_07065 [Streptomyces sp. NPDC058471]|uniref:hypothetical protein n=1 Tax=Streptomyces sp. NPDC058471 TaxID=3346516 RepID=UPI0036671FF3
MTPLTRTGRPVHLVDIRAARRRVPSSCAGGHGASDASSTASLSTSIEATTLTDTAEFQDFPSGHGYEREMSLDIPAKEVAEAVLATLPTHEKQSVLVS